MTIRLNKLIAYRGLAARRKADELIQGGQVKVNGVLVREPGTMVEEESDRVTVKGKPLPPAQRARWFMLHKPVGVISTVSDPEGRRTVRDLLPTGARVFPVGRLDADTSGLLLLTNDGPLAHKLMHPRYGVEKIYRVRLAEPAQSHHLRRLAQGVRFDEGLVSAPAQVRAIDPGFDAHMIEIRIHEGRFRQVRRMCEAVGLEVTGLHRVGYGPLRLGPLPRGEFRELFSDEVALLRSSSARPRPRPAGARGARGGRAKDEARRREIYMHGADAEPVREEAAGEREPRDPRPARGERSARTARPGRDAWRPGRETAPPAARGRRVPPPESEGELEERWGPGAGAERESFDAEWPARASGRRGDADFEGRERPTGSSRDARPARPARAAGVGRPARREDPAPRAERGARGRASAAPRGGRPARAPRGRPSAEAPARFRSGSAPRGRRAEVTPRGGRPAASAKGRRDAAAPGGRRNADPRGRATDAAPRGRRAAAAPKGRGGNSTRGFTQRTDRRGPASPQRGRDARRRDSAGPSGTAKRKRGGGVVSPRRRKG